MTTRTHVLLAALLGTAVIGATPIRATTLLSNLANGAIGDYQGNPDAANPFATGSAVLNVDAIEVHWFTPGPSPGVNRVSIHTDSLNAPSTTQVGSFFTNPNPTTAGVMSYSGQATLAANTTYWMVVHISDASQPGYNSPPLDVFADPSTGGATIPAGSAFGDSLTGIWNADPASILFALDNCENGPTTAWLLSCRYRVEIEWTDFQDVTRDAFVASAGTSDSALFYWTNPNNWEVLIKAIDACTLNNRHWIYFAAATNVGYRITVTDTQAGGSPKVYTNPVGNLAQATNDINAFDCP